VDVGPAGLSLISGASDLLSAANIKHVQKVRVMNHVRSLDVDVVLIDLGAGTTFNVLDFFLMSDVSILAVVPEPTSIENGYRFIKSALYRRLRTMAATEEVRALVDRAIDPKNEEGIKTPRDLLAASRPSTPSPRGCCAARSPPSSRASWSTRCATSPTSVSATSSSPRGAPPPGPARDVRGLRPPRRRGVAGGAPAPALHGRRPTSRAAEEIRQLTRGLVKGESLGPGY